MCVCACVKPLKSFMQRFSFRLPKQRVKIVASTRCCCQLLLLLSVVVASSCCCCCCLGLLNCCCRCCAKSLPRATANSKGSSRSRRRMRRASLQAKQTAAIFMLPFFVCPSLFLSPFFVVFALFLLLFLHLINGVSMESFPPCGRREKS